MFSWNLSSECFLKFPKYFSIIYFLTCLYCFLLSISPQRLQFSGLAHFPPNQQGSFCSLSHPTPARTTRSRKSMKVKITAMSRSRNVQSWSCTRKAHLFFKDFDHLVEFLKKKMLMRGLFFGCTDHSSCLCSTTSQQGIFKCILWKESLVFLIQISQEFVPWGSFD